MFINLCVSLFVFILSWFLTYPKEAKTDFQEQTKKQGKEN